MNEFLLLMHADALRLETGEAWATYFAKLRAEGRFEGGSSIGPGESLRKEGLPGNVHTVLSGYIKVLAHDLEDAKRLVRGNPVFEAGGTVEVRALPRS